ncbi:MAG: hypothetical protein HY814_02230 [Candidatus Riflebacteria bacterium]|nr:hypothetical protein [Candidatus Riflebacteria bacterium]
MFWELFVLALGAAGGGWIVNRRRHQDRARLEDAEREVFRLQQEAVLQDARVTAISRGLKMGLTAVGPDLTVLDDPATGGGQQGQEGHGRVKCFARLWNRTEACEECPAGRAFESGNPEASEVITGNGQSDREYYQVISSPVQGQDGQVTHVLEMVRDVTDRRRIEVHLLQAGKMAALGELAASIAHDINNPLASISAYAEQLAEAAQQPGLLSLQEFKKFPGHLATIRKNVKRCKEITYALLNFARRKEEPVEVVDVPLALEDTLSLVEHEARLGGKKIERQMPDCLPPVLGQRSELQQLFLNLLTNALDASPPGSAVTVRARVADRELAVDVEDRGTGIAASDRDHIFSPFFTTKPPGKGTGLGLAICARIIKKMKGRITFVTEEGAGTTFTVWLGLARPPLRPREAV